MVVQLQSCVQLFATAWTVAHQAPLSSTVSQSFLRLMSVESVMSSISSSVATFSSFLSLSQHRDLSQWVSSSHQVAKVLELHLQHQCFQWVLCILCAKLCQLCPTLCDPMDYSPLGSSVHGILQARILEWVAMSSSRGSSWPRDQTHVSYVSCLGRWVLYH